MKASGLFMPTATGFEPHDQRGRDLHERCRIRLRGTGKPVFLSMRTARNPEFSALAHLVFSRLGDALGVPMDAVKMYLKFQTGRFDLVKMPNGHVVRLPQSVSFEAMSEEDFRAFWADCLPVIFEQLLGKVKSRDYQEIVEIIGGTKR